MCVFYMFEWGHVCTLGCVYIIVSLDFVIGPFALVNDFRVCVCVCVCMRGRQLGRLTDKICDIEHFIEHQYFIPSPWCTVYKTLPGAWSVPAG